MNDHELMQALRDTRRVDDAGIATVTDRHALAALREGITMTDREAIPTTEAPRRGRRLGRRGATAGALAVLLVGGGAAYAVSQLSDTPILDGLNCAESMTLSSDGEVHLSGAVEGTAASGDDAADCAQIRADAGAVPLTDPYAFVYGGTHFVVSRSGVPSGVAKDAREPLPVAQQSTLLELESAMEDWVDGGGSKCFTRADAVPYMASELKRLGLQGWTTKVMPDNRPYEDGPCGFFDADPVTRTARFFPDRQADPNVRRPEKDMAGFVYDARDALRAKIADKCLSLPDAKRVARTLVDPLDDVTAVPDETASCTRVDMAVGGKIFVTLRGPAVAKP